MYFVKIYIFKLIYRTRSNTYKRGCTKTKFVRTIVKLGVKRISVQLINATDIFFIFNIFLEDHSLSLLVRHYFHFGYLKEKKVCPARQYILIILFSFSQGFRTNNRELILLLESYLVDVFCCFTPISSFHAFIPATIRFSPLSCHEILSFVISFCSFR